MFRVIVTIDHKDGTTVKTPHKFTTLDAAFSFIKEIHPSDYNGSLFIKYELFQLRKEPTHP